MQVVDELNRLAAAFIGLQRSVQGSSFEAVRPPQHHRSMAVLPCQRQNLLCTAVTWPPPAQPRQKILGGSLGWRS